MTVYWPCIYQRTLKGWGVYHLPSDTLLMDGLDKGEAAGFAMISNGEEEEGWECVGRKTAKRKAQLEEIRQTCLERGI